MKKAASIRPGALAGAPALLPAWPGGWLRLRQSAQALRNFATMQDKSNSLSAVLLGTNTDRRYTVLLHVLYWIATFLFLYSQSTWIVGQEHPVAVCILALSKLLVDLSAFYLISLAIRLSRSMQWAVLLTVLILVVVLASYGLQTFYIYRFIRDTIPGLHPVFYKIVGNM